MPSWLGLRAQWQKKGPKWSRLPRSFEGIARNMGIFTHEGFSAAPWVNMICGPTGGMGCRLDWASSSQWWKLGEPGTISAFCHACQGFFWQLFGLLKKGLQGQPLHGGFQRGQCESHLKTHWLFVWDATFQPKNQKFVNFPFWIWETKRGCSSHTGFSCSNFRVSWFLSQLEMKFQSWDLRTWCGKGGSSRSFGGDPCWGCEVDVLWKNTFQDQDQLHLFWCLYILYISLYDMYIIYICMYDI